MRHDFALTIPTADEIGAVAKTIAAVGGLLGGIWAILSRIAKRRREVKVRRELEAKAIRYLLDAMRHSLNALTPDERRASPIDADELVRQKALIDEVRDMIWVADGHSSEREAQRQAEDILRVITRTQAIERKALHLRAKREAIASGGAAMFKDDE
jgi:hypothetical protein